VRESKHNLAAVLLRDALLVAGIAVLTFQVLRLRCGDYYRVPSGSMQPLLYGHPASGDIVFVERLSRAEDCRRHDLVVVEHPLQPGEQLVKRIAARGDDKECCIDIRDGDVWLGQNAQHMAIEVKDPLTSRGMRVLWAAWPAKSAASHLDLLAARVESDCLVLPPLADTTATEVRALFHSDARRQRRTSAPDHCTPHGFLGTARVVDASYVDALGERGREGDDVQVNDCGMDLRIAAPAADVFAAIETRAASFTFHWQPAAGRIVLWCNGEDVAAVDVKVRPTGAHRVEFGRLDGRLFFAVEGRADAMLLVPIQKQWLASDNGPALPIGPRTHLMLGVVGAEPLRLDVLTVFRDTYAWREKIAGMPGQPGTWPKTVGAGNWFLLGDNAFDSHDSRQFQDVPSATFLGRPWFVLGPWPRTRWLRP
jgi:hypothetical protein